MRTKFFSLLVILVFLGGVTWTFWSKKLSEETVSLPPSLPSSTPAEPSDGFGRLVKEEGLGGIGILGQIKPKYFVVSGMVNRLGDKSVTIQGTDGSLGDYLLSDRIQVAISKEGSWERVAYSDSGLREGEQVELYVDLEKDGSYYVSLIQVSPFGY